MARIKLFNSVDQGNASRGTIRPEQIRTLEIEALVDTGAVSLALPADVVSTLGLREIDRRMFKLADGTLREFPIVSELYIEILGRGMACDALVVPAGNQALIGQIPLEGLDLVVDPRSRDVTVNPASPDVPIFDLMRAS